MAMGRERGEAGRPRTAGEGPAIALVAATYTRAIPSNSGPWCLDPHPHAAVRGPEQGLAAREDLSAFGAASQV
jgi:hypothetical protein